MKLLTHNMMRSHCKGVVNGFPLKLSSTQVDVKEIEFNADFVNRMLSRLEWSALVEIANQLGVGDGLPEMLPEEHKFDDEDVLKKIHHVLLEVEVIEGELECPETGRKFPISRGIPDMRLNEDE
ncbi:multifunctional methyltransferase subunit TRM112-like protein [Bolinopsis microptera]|uniref:multifunctional methyltransferase subunit TRM112-like protein n=1 Tax=Bolinopsis microptera TaxID=2820187 RepID=UPI003079311C